MTTDREALTKLIERVEQVVPYVLATLSPGNRIRVPDKPDWVQVHKGRCFSSNNQLEILLREAQELKQALEGPSEAP
jgi:hypothetical protein